MQLVLKELGSEVKSFYSGLDLIPASGEYATVCFLSFRKKTKFSACNVLSFL